MSVLKVDTINEKTSGNGVAIPGHVVQVVANNFTSAHVTTTSTSFVSMGSAFSLAITPKFDNSLIFIDVHLNPYVSGSSNSGLYNIHNGTAQIGHATNGFGVAPTHGTASGIYSHFTIHASDTVSSTSARTYQIYHRSDNGSVTFYGNHANRTNTIRLMEIAQ